MFFGTPCISAGLHKIENEESFLVGSKTNLEALKLLKTKRQGTFLVRFSSKHQQYCINTKNQVKRIQMTNYYLMDFNYFKEKTFIPIEISNILNQEFFYIQKGYSHASILDLVKDTDIRHEYNLMFPIYSDEADKVEQDAEYYKQKLLKVEKSQKNEVLEEDSEEEQETESLYLLPYYHGEITREEAELRLKVEDVGTFLIRCKIEA